MATTKTTSGLRHHAGPISREFNRGKARATVSLLGIQWHPEHGLGALGPATSEARTVFNPSRVFDKANVSVRLPQGFTILHGVAAGVGRKSAQGFSP